MHHIAFVALLALAVGCKDKGKDAAVNQPPAPPAVKAPVTPPPAPPAPPAGPATATAALEARSGSNVKGTVRFKAVDGGVEVTAAIEGLTPGDHAYHVHEKGDCSAPDAASAGGHFNPHAQPHGGPEAAAHHAGDFGNLTASGDGKATKTFVMHGITLGGDASSVVGKGFIVHEKADDLKTQPTGDAGGRVACGVIRLDAK